MSQGNRIDNRSAPRVLAKVGTIAYRLELLDQLSRVHSTFHISNMKKCLSDKPLAIPLDEIQIDDKLNFIEEPVEIIDREVKRLKQSHIPIVKVRWNSRRGPEFTWEREEQMQKKTTTSPMGHLNKQTYTMLSDMVLRHDGTQIIVLSDSLDDSKGVSSKGPTIPIVPVDGPSIQGLLDWYGNNNVEEYLSDTYFPSTDKDTTDKDNIDEDTIQECYSTKSKGKYVQVSMKHNPKVKTPIPIKGYVRGLANVDTWKDILKKFGVRK
nr:putative reverse transcriptase domain-containing protein [Tanacetum cinerariifolium]